LFGNRRLPQTPYAEGCSGGLLPPSPPGEKITARQDQAGKASAGDGTGGMHNELDIVDADEKWILNQDTDASGARDIFKRKVSPVKNF
jgi:hypothetical protein